MARVFFVRRTLRRWARTCPQNFEHRALLVDAEWLRTLHRTRRAIRRYEEAIAAARENGFVQDAALASELLSELLIERGRALEARPHLAAAVEGYRTWGAGAKVKDLENRYASLLGAV